MPDSTMRHAVSVTEASGQKQAERLGVPLPHALLCTCVLLMLHAILSIIKNSNACSLQCHHVLGILHRAWRLDRVQQGFVELNKQQSRVLKSEVEGCVTGLP